MAKEKAHQALIIFIVFLLTVSAMGYLFFPAWMLRVVGMESTPQTNFLVRTLAAALLALIPSAWAARKREQGSLFQSVVIGIAIYMFLSSLVDLHAFLIQLVNNASVPSIIFRVMLGGALLWLMPRE